MWTQTHGTTNGADVFSDINLYMFHNTDQGHY